MKVPLKPNMALTHVVIVQTRSFLPTNQVSASYCHNPVVPVKPVSKHQTETIRPPCHTNSTPSPCQPSQAVPNTPPEHTTSHSAAHTSQNKANTSSAVWQFVAPPTATAQVHYSAQLMQNPTTSASEPESVHTRCSAHAKQHIRARVLPGSSTCWQQDHMCVHTSCQRHASKWWPVWHDTRLPWYKRIQRLHAARLQVLLPSNCAGRLQCRHGASASSDCRSSSAVASRLCRLSSRH